METEPRCGDCTGAPALVRGPDGSHACPTCGSDEGSTASDDAGPEARAPARGAAVRPPHVAPIPPGLTLPPSHDFRTRYQPLGFLGRGAMGEVLLMRQVRLDRLVAVKLVRGEVMSAAEVRRLEKEAHLLASLSHPGILGIIDVCAEDETPYMVCEYISGETLRARLKREPALSLAQALKLVASILDALKAAHKQGIIHRDLKPANIFLTDAGKPKIGDFGLAKSSNLSSGTSSGRIVGTPAYMSPEQCRGHATTAASDLYAVGVLLFELVTGVRPFPGPDLLDYLTQHTRDPVPRARDRRPGVPAELDELIGRALAKDPAERPASARAFKKTLLEISKHQTSAAELSVTVHAPPAARRWRRAPALALGAGAILCVLIASAVQDAPAPHGDVPARSSPEASAAAHGESAPVVFGPSRSIARAVAVGPGGSLVVAGRAVRPEKGSWQFAVARLRSDATPDPAFGDGGVQLTRIGPYDDTAYAVAALPDGRVIAGGAGEQRGFGYDFALAHFRPDGLLDTAVNPGGVQVLNQGSGQHESSTLHALITLADGRVIGAGVGTSGGKLIGALVRLGADGRLDASFGTAGSAHLALPNGPPFSAAIAPGPAGSTWFAAPAGPAPDYQIIVGRVDGAGRPDSSFLAGSHLALEAARGQALAGLLGGTDGTLLVLGHGTREGAAVAWLARIGAAGTLDSNFGAGGIALLAGPGAGLRPVAVLRCPRGGTEVVAQWRSSGQTHWGILHVDAHGAVEDTREAGVIPGGDLLAACRTDTHVVAVGSASTGDVSRMLAARLAPGCATR